MTAKVEKMDKASGRKNDDLSHAVRVLEAEAEGLRALAKALDGGFTAAIDLIQSMKDRGGGRLIVAGIGKSGHVARKIAATLASTGTPSFFVHPGEASHGDLGMITENDIVLLLSYSGESAELSDLIHYTRRFGVKLIGITGGATGTLAKHADITLLLPKVPEACPNGLAPTTSTTMMLALGDAIAVALLERMGLTPEQFRVFHPGGKLGQKLKTVHEIMHDFDELPIVGMTAKMDEALLVLTGKNLGCVLVTDGARGLRGLITDGDLKRHMGPDLLTKKVTDIMTVSPMTIGADALAAEAVNVMTRTPGRYVTSLVVTEADGKLCGLIRLQDCLQAGVV
jgi:arabinose-5-phosphate isomerase